MQQLNQHSTLFKLYDEDPFFYYEYFFIVALSLLVLTEEIFELCRTAQNFLPKNFILITGRRFGSTTQNFLCCCNMPHSAA
jgi:hypothetical protein